MILVLYLLVLILYLVIFNMQIYKSVYRVHNL